MTATSPRSGEHASTLLGLTPDDLRHSLAAPCSACPRVPAVLTCEEAAAYLRVTVRSLRPYLGTRIPASKVGREWRIAKAALDRFLEAPSPEPSGAGSAL